MEVCNVMNEVAGEKSVLHAQLLEIFNDQHKADLLYSKVLGNDFGKVFGDWKKNYKGIRDANGLLAKIGEVTDKGEPKLYNKKNSNKWYFKDVDGTKIPVNSLTPLRDAFSPQEIKDVSKHFLYRFDKEGGPQAFNDGDAKDKSKRALLSSIERSIESYKQQLSTLPKEKAKIGTKRIELVELYKHEFKDELVFKLAALGQNYQEKIIDAEGNVKGEVKEEEKGGGLNMIESITVNAKESATINTKIFLSQLVSKRLVKSSDPNSSNQVLKIKRSGFLKTPVFEDFNQVWQTLQPLLSDIVTTGGTEGGVVSTYKQMREVIERLKTVKPWAYDLAEKLDTMNNDNGVGRFKVYEFVQAFNKTNVNFYVTEFNQDSSAYTVINATATNSRESQILDRWGYRFRGKWLGGGQANLSIENLKEINFIGTAVSVLYTKFREGIGQANGDRSLENEVYEEIVPKLFQQLRNLGVFGLMDSDINALIMLGGGTENEFNTIKDLFVGIGHMINGDITAVDKKGAGKPFIKDGAFLNPFRTQSMVKMLAKASAMRELDIAESSILASGGMTYFAYANPTFISNKISEWKKDLSGLEALASDPINGSSRWIKYLLGYKTRDVFGQEQSEHNKKARLKRSQERLDAFEHGLASSFTSKGKDDGVDNVSISLADQLNDNITKLLGKKIGQTSYFPTIIAADKSRRVEFKGFEFVDSLISGDKDSKGKLLIPQRTVDIFVKYFESEYNRMKDVANDIETLPEHKKVQHYHIGAKNGLKSQLFPEFSFDTASDSLKAILYDPKTNMPLSSNGVHGFSDSQRNEVRLAVEASLKERLNDTYKEVKELSKTSQMNSKLIAHYKDEGGLAAIAGDYLVNGLVSSIEYTKLFSGDPAYFKNNADLIKRIPATYTDGLQLALDSADDMKFNVAVVEGVEVASKYLQQIRDSLTDKSIADAYGARYDKNGKKKKGTSDVNTTDAQAWITPRRWKFIKQRLGQWTDAHAEVFKKMQNGNELKDSEMKLAAQPLKGVYFEINKGIPTYLKYSQAVLIPSMVKNTPMAKLLKRMTHDRDGNYIKKASDEVHEVITIDGVKVGAIAPTRINKEGTTDMDPNFKLNTNTLSNRGWKLQQDLPIKTMHETNLGSQIQKNILEDLKLDLKYKVSGEVNKIDGSELLQRIHDAISKLIEIGADEVSAKLGIVDNKITDKDPIYDVLIAEFRSRGANENIITALEKGTPIDAIPQIKGRIDSILMSVFNRAMTKIATEGGSFIQVSPFGLEEVGVSESDLLDAEYDYLVGKYGKEKAELYTQGVDPLSKEDNVAIKKLKADLEDSSIKIISDNYDGKGLQPPTQGPDGQTLPGQVMIPHTLAVKLLRDAGRDAGVDVNTMTPADWKKAFKDPKVRELVGYRIPNQGMSSNDTLEIVAVLPSTMGDSIIGYDGIPAKTGSDFDIDKMYIMAPNLMYNKKSKEFEMISDENKKFLPSKQKAKADKLIAQNNVLKLYSDVLQSDHTYDNMMTSIDGLFLKEDIENLHPKPKDKNLDLFSPITQLKTKMNYMSGKMGVALTANQLVDHVANQSLEISVNSDLGFGEAIKVGKNKSITKMDVPNGNKHSVVSTLSAFLNAYVDIAKDPYITRGNHNDVTANVTFMLIRAGGSMEDINRYIGQPILKELVALKKRVDSITGTPLTIVVDGKVKYVNPYEYLRNKYDIKNIEGSQKKLRTISKSDMEQSVKGVRKTFVDSVVLNAFEFHEKKSAQWTDALLSAKIDTRGAGGSPIEMHIASNKINKVEHVGFVNNYMSKYDGTALGTYKAKALDFTNSVLTSSNIMLSATSAMQDVMDHASNMMTKEEYIVSKKLGAAVDKGVYTYLMSRTELLKKNRSNFEKLFEKIPKQVSELRESQRLKALADNKKIYKPNFLIQELEINMVNGFDFIGINGKDKPAEYQNDIYRAWIDLYKNEKTKNLAVNLVRYSYTQSGFQQNLNQFFTHIPHEILRDEGINAETNSFFQRIDDIPGSVFFDQFARHESNNTEVVPRLNDSDIEPIVEGSDMNYGFIGTKKLLDKYQKFKMGVAYPDTPEFVTVKLDDGTIGFFKKSEGFIEDVYADNDYLPAYERTFRLGLKAGKNKVFEYSYEKKIESSILEDNNFNGAELMGINKIRKELKANEMFIDDSQELPDILSDIENAEDEISDIEEEEYDGPSFEITPDMLKNIIKEENITKKDCPSGKQ